MRQDLRRNAERNGTLRRAGRSCPDDVDVYLASTGPTTAGV